MTPAVTVDVLDSANNIITSDNSTQVTLDHRRQPRRQRD